MARRRRTMKGRTSPETASYAFAIPSRLLVRALAAIAASFLAIHLVIFLWHYLVAEVPWLLRQLFDLDQENNLPTWFSAFLLLLASALLWLRAQASRGAGERWTPHWYALATGFLLLSVDEVAGVHETINTMIVMSWAIPGLILSAAVGVCFVPMLLALPRPTAIRFAVAGAIYVAGAAGLELLGNDLALKEMEDTLQYDLAALVEEGFEMFGVILFVHALLRSMRGPGDGAVRAEATVS